MHDLISTAIAYFKVLFLSSSRKLTSDISPALRSEALSKIHTKMYKPRAYNWQLSYEEQNRPFPSSPGPLHQNEVRCSTFDMEMIFHFHANKTHFHKKN